MVGTRRTNACETCRRRRVKCDEVKPVCGQCAIKGRDCTESPPPRVIWARNGQLSAEGSSTNLSISPETNRIIRLTHAAAVPGGGVIHKYRLGLNVCHSSNSLQAVGMSPIDKLRSQFLDAYLRGPPGLRLSGFSPLLSDLPRHLGVSKALDDALSCLIHSYDIRSRGEVANGTAPYLMALSSLQEALNSPTDAARCTTLCAITLLTWTEVLGEECLDKAYVQHVGGLAALIKLLGPSCVQEGLAKDVAIGAAGSIIMDAIMKNEPCFLNEPKWSWIFSDNPRGDESRRLLIRMLQHFSLIATLAVRVRSASGPDSRESTAPWLFEEAVRLRHQVLVTKNELDMLLGGEGLETRQHKQPAEGSPITSTYWFKDPTTARAASMCWALLIYINNIVIYLTRLLNQSGISITTVGIRQNDLDIESASLGKKILMLTTYAAQFAPVGSVYMRFPIYIAWGTISMECKGWTVDELHKLNGGLVVDYHTLVALDWMSRLLYGRNIMSWGL